VKREYLVTGGAGFIGSHIVRALVRRGDSVRVLDNLSTGKMANIIDLFGRIEFMRGDIRHRPTTRKAAQGVRCVFHLAALPYVAESVHDPLGSDEINAGGTLNMLEAARAAGAERFIFSSSAAVYGDAPGLPKSEDMLPAPMSPYGVQKAVGEYYCRVFHSLHGLNTFALRYFNVFGPRQDPRSQYAGVIAAFVSRLERGERPVIHGDGRQTRDFIFVEDVVRANLACARAPARAAGQVFNVAGGRSVTITQLARTLIRIMGQRVKPAYGEPRPGDVRHSRAAIRKAKALLGWEPRVSFEDGLRQTVEWFARDAG
jgi:UDP-glucose 4-epimerase